MTEKISVVPPSLLAGPMLRFAAGETLHWEAGGLLIGEGMVCALSAAHRQRALPLCLLWAGDLLGEESALRLREGGLQLRAVTPVQGLPLQPLGATNAAVFHQMGKRTAQKFALQADWRIAGGAFERVVQTLRLLAQWALGHPAADARRRGWVKTSLSTTALAHLCGLSRRHTGEALAPLEAAGWLQTRRTGLLLRWPNLWLALPVAAALDRADVLLAALEQQMALAQKR